MQLLARFLLALTLSLPLACTAADAPKYQLGKDYKTVRQPVQTSDPTKIEVMEVFSYHCPHCFTLDPTVEKWVSKKPADVVFVRLPVTFGMPANEFRNKAYYASEMLGVTSQFHRALFGAIHGEGRMMNSEADMRKLFIESTGVKAEDFDGAYKSFATDSRYRIGENTIRDLGVSSVPQVVVDGRYMVPNGAKLFDVVDFLVEQVRQERKAGKSR
jgi:protein dithiol oxidoreductase (disulfide-forming)